MRWMVHLESILVPIYKKSMVLGPPVCTYEWKGRSVSFGNGRWSRGLTTVIRAVFAPTYRFKKLCRTTCPGGLRLRAAKRRGRAIDEALARWVQTPTTYRSTLNEPDVLIRLFTGHGWLPVDAQLVVAWPDARLATRIDLVLYDPGRNMLVVVEMKSGCAYRRVAHGTLHNVVPITSNAPLHQHQLQALLGKELLLQTYPKWTRSAVEAVVVYVTTAYQVELVREPDFGVVYSPHVQRALLRTA